MYVPVRRQLAEHVASILTPSSLDNYCGCNVILYHLYQYVEWQLTYSMYYNLAVPDSKVRVCGSGIHTGHFKVT
jgi:hypothetical protein